MAYVPSSTPQQYDAAYLWNELQKIRQELIRLKSGGIYLDDLGDVNSGSATSGQSLKFNGSNWINSA